MRGETVDLFNYYIYVLLMTVYYIYVIYILNSDIGLGVGTPVSGSRSVSCQRVESGTDCPSRDGRLRFR